MPLVDPNETERVEFENGDWYDLRKQLSWYEANQAKFSYLTPNYSTLEAITSKNANGAASKEDLIDKVKGEVVKSIDSSTIVSDINLSKVKVYLAAWSHSEEITSDNIKRIPQDQFQVLLDKVKEREGDAANAAPFPGKQEPVGADTTDN